MTFKEYFEKEVGKKMSDYIQRYVEINQNKYGNDITSNSFITTIERHKVTKFATPMDFVKYFNGVAKNMSTQSEWEEI